VASHFEYLSSSYNILKLQYKDDFNNIYNKYKDYWKNNNCEYNITLSWIFLYFLKIGVFSNLKYKDYVYMFKSKAKKIEEFAKKIINGEIEIEKKKEIKIEINEEKQENKEIKKGQKKKEEIKEENQEEIKEEDIIIEDISKDDEINEEIKIENNEKEKNNNEELKNKFNNEIELKNNLKDEIVVVHEKKIENLKTDDENKDKKDISKKKRIDLEIINLDNINKNKKFNENLILYNKNKYSRKNNFIESIYRNKINRSQKLKSKSKSKISCWCCCGADSVDVI